MFASSHAISRNLGQTLSMSVVLVSGINKLIVCFDVFDTAADGILDPQEFQKMMRILYKLRHAKETSDLDTEVDSLTKKYTLEFEDFGKAHSFSSVCKVLHRHRFLMNVFKLEKNVLQPLHFSTEIRKILLEASYKEDACSIQ